jgi:hypothetical protein
MDAIKRGGRDMPAAFGGVQGNMVHQQIVGRGAGRDIARGIARRDPYVTTQIEAGKEMKAATKSTLNRPRGKFPKGNSSRRGQIATRIADQRARTLAKPQIGGGRTDGPVPKSWNMR